MALIFNTTGISAEETSVIRANIAQQWKNAFATDPTLPELDTSAETPAGQLIDGETALAAEKDNEILFVANQFDPKNAVGAWQDALAAIYFIKRKIALPTMSLVKLLVRMEQLSRMVLSCKIPTDIPT